MSEIEVKALEAMRVALTTAYLRGAEWYRENDDFGALLYKAAQDYADYETSPLTLAERATDFDARIRSAIERKAEPVAWQWCAYEDGSQRTSWYPEGDSYQADWEELAKKYPDKYQVVTRPLYSTPPAAAVTEGWQLVPKEPTEEMLDAYWHQTGESKEMRSRTHAYMRRYYSAMLSASPSPVGEGRDGLIEALKAKAREVGPLFIEDIDEVVRALAAMSKEPAQTEPAPYCKFPLCPGNVGAPCDHRRCDPQYGAALSAAPSPVDSRDALIERLREENADLRSELYRRGQEADDTWLTERERAW